MTTNRFIRAITATSMIGILIVFTPDFIGVGDTTNRHYRHEIYAKAIMFVIEFVLIFLTINSLKKFINDPK